MGLVSRGIFAVCCEGARLASGETFEFRLATGFAGVWRNSPLYVLPSPGFRVMSLASSIQLLPVAQLWP